MRDKYKSDMDEYIKILDEIEQKKTKKSEKKQ